MASFLKVLMLEIKQELQISDKEKCDMSAVEI